MLGIPFLLFGFVAKKSKGLFRDQPPAQLGRPAPNVLPHVGTPSRVSAKKPDLALERVLTEENQVHKNASTGF